MRPRPPDRREAEEAVPPAAKPGNGLQKAKQKSSRFVALKCHQAAPLATPGTTVAVHDAPAGWVVWIKPATEAPTPFAFYSSRDTAFHVARAVAHRNGWRCAL